MANIKKLNYGKAPGDHLGDELFYIFKDTDDNIQLLKDQQGPCIGTKYLDFRLSIKGFSTRRQYLFDNFYVSKIITGNPESGKYRYTIEISKSSSFLLAGTVVMQYTTLANALKQGFENIYLAEYNTSGLFGKILVNWSLLANSVTYTTDLPVEGFLFVVNVIADGSNPGGGGDPGMEVPIGGGKSFSLISEEATIDGTFDSYLVSLSSGVITLASGELIKRTIEVKNISGRDVTFNCPAIPPVDTGPTTSAPFDGVYEQITVADKKTVWFDIYETEPGTYMTVVTGDYTGIEL